MKRWVCVSVMILVLLWDIKKILGKVDSALKGCAWGTVAVERGRAGTVGGGTDGGRNNSEPKAVGRSEEPCIFRSEDCSRFIS